MTQQEAVVHAVDTVLRLVTLEAIKAGPWLLGLLIVGLVLVAAHAWARK